MPPIALADPDRIAVGQMLVVPPAGAPLLRVEVRPRDTIASLARRFSVQPADVQAINELAPGQRLEPGQDLLVPAPPGQPSPALPPGPIRNITVTPTWCAKARPSVCASSSTPASRSA